MTNPYNHPGYEHPTEHEAQERELAFIKWQEQDARNELKALNAAATMTCPYRGLDGLRRKLTSWPARLSKWFDVARALAVGWWNQLTVKEQRCIVDGAVVAIGSMVVIAIFGWLSLR